MEQELSYTSLLMITLLAFFVPLILAKIPRLSIPIVVGEILAGIIVGKSGFNLIAADSSIQFLSSFGFTYLMFLSGLEIDLGLLFNRSSGKKGQDWYKGPIAIGVGVFLGTLLMSTTIAYTLYTFHIVQSFMLMALILSTTSLGVVVPILKERRMISTGLGQTILLSALIADFVTMVLITVVASIIGGGQIAKVLLIFVLFVAFFALYRLGLLLSQMKILHKLAHATSQIRVRGAFALILVFVALSQRLGSEIILGAFLAGVIISLLSKHHGSDLHMKLDAIGYGFFIPIFFIMVGVKFNLAAITESKGALLLIPILLLAAYTVKLVPGLLFRLKFGWRDTISSGFLLSSRLSLIIAASQIGLDLKVISPAVNSSIILVAILTVTVSPIVYQRLAPVLSNKEEKLIVVIGIGQVGVFLVNRLQKIYGNVVHLSIDEGAAGVVKETKIKKIPKSIDSFKDALNSLDLNEANAYVAATDNEEMNYRLANQLVGMNAENIYAVLSNEDWVEELSDAGVHVVTPNLATELVLENMIRNPQTFSLLAEGRTDRKIAEIQVHTQVSSTKIRDLRLPEGILILSITRGDEVIVPHGNTLVRKGDVLSVLGTSEEVEKTAQLLTIF